jgi:hypothetical protein
MKPTVLGLAAFVYLLSVAITFAIIRTVGFGEPEFAFIIAAIVSTNVAAYWHSRTYESSNSLSARAMLAIAIAVAAFASGLLLEVAFAPFKFATVSIPMAVIGTFVFPFVLFSTFWNGLTAPKNADPK